MSVLQKMDEGEYTPREVYKTMYTNARPNSTRPSRSTATSQQQQHIMERITVDHGRPDDSVLPSTSTMQSSGNSADTGSSMSSDEWLNAMRKKAATTKTMYTRIQSSPSSADESQEAEPLPVITHRRRNVVKRSRSTTTGPPLKKAKKTQRADDAVEARSNAPQVAPTPPRGRKRAREDEVHIREPEPDRLPYSIRSEYQRSIKRLGAVETVYVIKFNRKYIGTRLIDMTRVIHDMFDDVIKKMSAGRRSSDRGRLHIQHNDLHKPIVVHLRELELLTPESILQRLENVLQSAEGMLLDEGFTVKAGVVVMPAGGRGEPRMKVINLNRESADNSLRKKRSTVEIPYNTDNLCAAKSLVICRAHKSNMPTAEWQRLRLKKNHNSKQLWSLKSQAARLHREAGFKEGSLVDVEHISKFENILNAQIVVFTIDNVILHVGKDNPVKYFLYYEQHCQHFTPILSVAGFLGSGYFCESCLKPYTDKKTHKCFDTCKLCKNLACEPTGALTCRTCKMVCRSDACFKRHKEETVDGEPSSICKKFKRCLDCLSVIHLDKRSFESHECGECYCYHCGVHFKENEHVCYIQTTEPQKTSGVFYFFDCETRMEDVITCPSGYEAPPRSDCDACAEVACSAHSKCVNCKRTDCQVPQHVVNYVVCQSQCDECAHRSIEQPCDGCGTRCTNCDTFKVKTKRTFVRRACRDTCGKRQTVFKTIEAFGEFLFKPYHAGSVVLSHNGGKYDKIFVLNYALKNGIKPDTIIYAGGRIMMMHMKGTLNIRFLDSLSFLPMALRKLPKAFGLVDTEKGDFPYFFNTKRHENYRGVYPPPEYYGVASMMPEAREEFLQWHEKQTGVFDMQDQIHRYCVADVTILREACIKFRNLMLSITRDDSHPGLDVFSCTTIASVCMKLFRTKFLEQQYMIETPSDGDSTIRLNNHVTEKGGVITTDTGVVIDKSTILSRKNIVSDIGRSPPGGYASLHGFSKVALEWLSWVSKEQNIIISHALNTPSGEVRIGCYKVDGFHQGTPSTVYEFNGCRFHGCSCVKDRDLRHPYNAKNMNQLLAMTAKKEAYLRDIGYKVVSMWECQWRSKVSRNASIKQHLETVVIRERLQPRDAFFGGRTAPFKLYHKVLPGEEIHYVDFTSLYPWVNKYCRYPVGHPEIVTSPSLVNFNTYFGIAKVDVLPPHKLLYGVLPVRVEGKLMFPLCRTCSHHLSQESCTCSDAQRMLSGTWCTPEINLAVEQGTFFVIIT